MGKATDVLDLFYLTEKGPIKKEKVKDVKIKGSKEPEKVKVTKTSILTSKVRVEKLLKSNKWVSKKTSDKSPTIDNVWISPEKKAWIWYDNKPKQWRCCDNLKTKDHHSVENDLVSDFINKHT